MSRSKATNTASSPAIARPVGVFRSNASVTETKPTPGAVSSCNVDTRSATDRPRRSNRQTSTTSISRRRAVADGAPAPPRRIPLLSPLQQRSSRVSMRTRAKPASASEASADPPWRRAHTDLPATFSLVCVTGQKTSSISTPESSVWRAFPQCIQRWPETIVFGQFIPRQFGPASGDSSTASTPPGWPRSLAHGAAVPSDTRTNWRRTAGRCESDS